MSIEASEEVEENALLVGAIKVHSIGFKIQLSVLTATLLTPDTRMAVKERR